MKVLRFVVAVLCAASLFFCTLTAQAAGSDAPSALADGVDVSYWQKAVEWKKVKAAGVEYVIIRMGTSGGMDEYFLSNYYGAKLAGLDVGAYLYTTASDVEGAKKDADTAIAWLKGKRLEYPVYYDIEHKNQSALTSDQRTAMILAFCDKLKAAGYLTGVYGSQNAMNGRFDSVKIGKTHELWMAAWPESGEATRDYSTTYGMWQYSATGKVDGISVAVDRNVAYKDYPAIIKQKKLNGYGTVTSEVLYPAGVYAVTASSLTVRSGTSASTSKLGTLAKDKEITVLSSENGWGLIRYQNKNAYVDLTYTRVVSLAGESADKRCGDLNKDGSVTLTDSILLSRYLAGWKGYTVTDDLLPYADLDKDGSVTLTDSILLSRHLAGWKGYETLPVKL